MFFDVYESRPVDGANYEPIETCEEIFRNDISVRLERIINWITENDVELTSPQLFALLIHHFKRGDLGQNMADLLRQYRDNELDSSDMYQAWSDSSPLGTRRDCCQRLFFGEET